jgi:leader peptidase (prepilin peptidase)/N-methyltransferase
VFLISLMVGSFLNVVIYRLPIMLERDWKSQAREILAGGESDASVIPPAEEPVFTLSKPRSTCPKCKAPILAHHNIPVVSWLLLKGRCASCKNPISARYPVVELLTGITSAWVAWRFGFGVPAAAGIAITWCLIALAGIDFDHQILPDSITLPLVWTGLLAAALLGAQGSAPLPVAPKDAILGAASGYMSLFIVSYLYKLLMGRDGMGNGDFKLFAAFGAWLGWKVLWMIILMSAGAGAVIGIAMILLRGRDRLIPIPFGPYLAIAGWIVMLYGASLLDGYLRISGIRH